jgi:hypothetical protein
MAKLIFLFHPNKSLGEEIQVSQPRLVNLYKPTVIVIKDENILLVLFGLIYKVPNSDIFPAQRICKTSILISCCLVEY